MSYAYNFMGRYCNGRFLVVGAVGKTARLIRVHWQPVKTYCQSVLHHTWLCVINMDFALSWRAAPKQQARWREQMFGAIENFGRVDCNFSIKFREIKRFIFYELQSLYGECLFFLRVYQGHSSLEILEPYLVLFGFVSVCVCARVLYGGDKKSNKIWHMKWTKSIKRRIVQHKPKNVAAKFVEQSIFGRMSSRLPNLRRRIKWKQIDVHELCMCVRISVRQANIERSEMRPDQMKRLQFPSHCFNYSTIYLSRQTFAWKTSSTIAIQRHWQ